MIKDNQPNKSNTYKYRNDPKPQESYQLPTQTTSQWNGTRHHQSGYKKQTLLNVGKDLVQGTF